MINAYQDPIAFDYKICFDGYDFLTSQLGKSFCNHLLESWIRDHHNRHELDFAESFIQDCMRYRRQREPSHPLPIELRDKYEVGLFVTSPDNCFNHPYALFNYEALKFWSSDQVQTFDQVFLVRPSRDSEGRINEIGFRILNTQTVQEAFKWIFMCGQQATYGLEGCREGLLTLVEGAWDQIALKESGEENIVGLGSVRITEGHRKFLTQDYQVCWDADRFGLAERKGVDKFCFYQPEGKDPFDAWVQHGKVKLLQISPN